MPDTLVEDLITEVVDSMQDLKLDEADPSSLINDETQTVPVC